jgi:putative restriction endonuclease
MPKVRAELASQRQKHGGRVKGFIAVTNPDWYRYLLSRPDLDEVNFWRPMGNTPFRALKPGQPFLFKLPFPEHAIVGGGFFAHYTALPVSLAWEAFGPKNGAATFALMRELIEKYRRRGAHLVGPNEDYTIGCILLMDPFFLPPDRWIAPPKWSKSIVFGRTEDLSTPAGRALWTRVLAARGASGRDKAGGAPGDQPHPPVGRSEGGFRVKVTDVYRPGGMSPGVFRIAVTDAYHRQCAVTREKTLPVLQPVPIRPEHAGGELKVSNGLLLRSDLRTLFELGFVSVGPDMSFMVSSLLRKRWSNGEEYYARAGRAISAPDDRTQRPDPEALRWHNEAVFRP